MTGCWYHAYGLRIHTELPLPAPVCAPSTADVRIRFDSINITKPEIPNARSVLRANPEEICCRWDDAGTVLIRGGKEIIIDPASGTSAETLATWVQGAAMSILLHQRGFLLLHASAVAVGDGAVAFMGESGWGKSTSAAALCARGHRLLVDDVVAVLAEPNAVPRVIPGFPHLKLMPEALAFLGEDGTNLPQVAGDDVKKMKFSREGFSAEPVQLKHVFVLGEGEKCVIEPLPPQAALMELVKHAFVATRSEFLRLTGTAESHFANCTRLVQSASVCRLRRPKSFDMLPTMIEMVEQRISGNQCVAQEA